MPEQVEECVASVMRDNPGMDESRAYAICNAMANEGKLQDGTVSPATFEDVDSCEVAMDGAGLDNPREVCEQLFADPQLSEPLYVRLADTRQPGPIERVEEDGQVRYKNLKLLGTGIWGDSGTQSHFLYSDQTIEALADSVVDTTANLFHEQENEVAEVGDLDAESVYIGEADGGLYGDLVLDLQNAASEFADEALQNALETSGREGLKGPSLEIKNPDYEFDMDSGVMEVVDGEIHGIALVGLGVSAGPGSKDVAFDRQTAERAVALADADNPTIVTLQTNEMKNMNDEQTVRQLLSELDSEDIQELADEYGIDLQDDGEMAMVQDLIAQAQQEGFDLGDQSAEELRQFISENLDPSEDAMAAFEDVASAYLETEEAESLEVTPAEGLLDFINEQGEAEEEPEEGENEGPPEEGEMADRLAQIEQAVDSLTEQLTTLADETEPLRQSDVGLSDLDERLSEKPGADRFEELDQRLTALEESLEEPQSLADIGDRESVPDEEDSDVILGEWSGAYRTSHDSFAVPRNR